MRIGIDFHAAEREGTGNCTYIRNVVEHLVRMADEHDYFLYVGDGRNPYYDRFRSLQNVRLRPLSPHSPVARMALLGWLTFRDKIDVLHATYYGPPLHRGRLLLTVHDLSFLHVPESFSTFDRIKDVLLIPLFLKKARRVLTVSQYSRADIVDRYGIPPARVSVCYNGVDPIFRPVADEAPVRDVLARYGLSPGRPYILFVGRINSRKNLPRLVEAFNLLKKTKAIAHELVIAGSKDFLPAEDEKVIGASPCIGDIRFTGRVAGEHLPVLYGLADVFVYPSLYEGFGLPCLEAMACGCPVVASDCTSIPEVVGEAAVLVNPRDAEGLAGAIYGVISDKRARGDLVRKGLKQASRFNWESAAAGIVDILKEYDIKN